MEPRDQELYDQLVGYLAAEGVIEENVEAGTLRLVEFEHHDLEPPLTLHVTPAALGRHLRVMAPLAAGAFPDVPPIDAAWRLFLVHLAEGVWTAAPGDPIFTIELQNPVQFHNALALANNVDPTLGSVSITLNPVPVE